jgi:hypothetical protein
MTKPRALTDTPKSMILVMWGVDGPSLVEIIPPSLRDSAKDLCEFAISHMEANMKTHRPKQGLKGLTFHSVDEHQSPRYYSMAPGHIYASCIDQSWLFPSCNLLLIV